MSRTITRTLKQTTHPLGLPCSGCGHVIPEDERYTEEVRPSEQRRQYCGDCRPTGNLGTSRARRGASEEMTL